MEFTITNKDLESYEQYKELIQDHPLYASTSGLNRVEIVLLGKLMENEWHDQELSISIKPLGTKS